MEKNQSMTRFARIALISTAAVLGAACSKQEPQILEKDPSYKSEDRVVIVADTQSGKLEETVWTSDKTYTLRSARPGGSSFMSGDFTLKDQATLDAEKAAKDAAAQAAKGGPNKGAVATAKKEPEKKIPVKVEDVRKERQLFHMQENLAVRSDPAQHKRLRQIYDAVVDRANVPENGKTVCTKNAGTVEFYCALKM